MQRSMHALSLGISVLLNLDNLLSLSGQSCIIVFCLCVRERK